MNHSKRFGIYFPTLFKKKTKKQKHGVHTCSKTILNYSMQGSINVRYVIYVYVKVTLN